MRRGDSSGLLHFLMTIILSALVVIAMWLVVSGVITAGIRGEERGYQLDSIGRALQTRSSATFALEGDERIFVGFKEDHCKDEMEGLGIDAHCGGDEFCYCYVLVDDDITIAARCKIRFMPPDTKFAASAANEEASVPLNYGCGIRAEASGSYRFEYAGAADGEPGTVTVIHLTSGVS